MVVEEGKRAAHTETRFNYTNGLLIHKRATNSQMHFKYRNMLEIQKGFTNRGGVLLERRTERNPNQQWRNTVMVIY